MKSEVQSDTSGRLEHLKEPLVNPEPIEAAKSFPGNMEVIGKAGSEFATLCADSRHRSLRDTVARRDSDKSLPGRKKRKSQQAGPSDCSLKEGRISDSSLAPQRPRVEPLERPSEDDHNRESSFSDCAASPSSSLRFGDSEALSSEDELEAGATGGQRKSPPAIAAAAGGTGAGLRPILSRTRGNRSHKWARSEAEPVLHKRQCAGVRRPLHRKRFVKAAPGGAQRTQKQKERLLLQRKKREVIARRKYALLHSTSSSSEELSSGSSSPSSTEAEEDELYVDVSSTSSQPNTATVAAGKWALHTQTHGCTCTQTTHQSSLLAGWAVSWCALCVCGIQFPRCDSSWKKNPNEWCVHCVFSYITKWKAETFIANSQSYYYMIVQCTRLTQCNLKLGGGWGFFLG